MDFTLTVLPSKFGLPSFNPECLATLAYCKFGNAQVRINSALPRRFGFIHDQDLYPNLCDGAKKWKSMDVIFDILRENNFNADSHLSNKECADAAAFIELMKSKLRPAVWHTFWLESSNLENEHRTAYANSMPFPGSILYIRQLTHKAFSTVYTAQAGDFNFISMAQAEKKIYEDAVNCLDYLSNKLGSKPFLLGNTPTTVDAIMFGYLAPILKIKFPQNRLKGHLEGHQNLCNTIEHILKKYFHSTFNDQSSRSLLAENLYEEFPHKERNAIMATVFFLTVVVTYALLRGVVTVNVSKAK